MNERQRREIAESAFKRQFSDVEGFRIDVRPGFALKDDSPVIDVNTVYDGKHEQSSVRGFMRIRSELVDKAWREVKDDLGWPCVHFVPRSEIEEKAPATA